MREVAVQLSAQDVVVALNIDARGETLQSLDLGGPSILFQLVVASKTSSLNPWPRLNRGEATDAFPKTCDSSAREPHVVDANELGGGVVVGACFFMTP